MAMTYAVIGGRVTAPGSDIGIHAEVTATPMTVNEGLKFPAEDRLTWGPQKATTGTDGTLTGLKVPTNHGIPGLLWEFTARALDRVPGLKQPQWVMGHYEITADTRLDDLVDIVPATVSPALRDDLADVASGLAVAYSLGFDTDGAPYMTELAGLPGSPIGFDTDGAPYLTTGA